MDFYAEDITLAFLKPVTHFLPGLLFLKGVFSLFDSTNSHTISIISCNEGLKPTLNTILIQSANCFSFYRAQQIAHMVSSVHTTCTQRGFCMHQIMCT